MLLNNYTHTHIGIIKLSTINFFKKFVYKFRRFTEIILYVGKCIELHIPEMQNFHYTSQKEKFLPKKNNKIKIGRSRNDEEEEGNEILIKYAK